MDSFLRVEHLKKYFKSHGGILHAVDDVSFSIEEGKTIGVVGESGCGKSTLGRVMIHLLDSTDGKIIYKGEDVTKPDRKRLSELRSEMQMIFQDPYSSLNPKYTVFQALEEPLLIQQNLKVREREEKVYEIMEMVGLAERLVNTFPHELDGGRRQRIGIGRALSINPRFIVCDEPVSALDVSIQAQILNLLQEIQEKMNLTYMFITHDLAVVKYISDKILVMYLGQVVEFADSEELFANPLNPYTKALLSAVPVPDIEQRKERVILKGEVTSPIDPKPGCRFASRCAYATEACFSQTPELREVSEGHWVRCVNV